MTRQRHYGEELPMSAWLRKNPNLDSHYEYLSIQDVDYWIHKYRDYEDNIGRRLINHMMMVEVKVLDGEPSFAQRDTLNMLNQMAEKEVRGLEVLNERGESCRLHFYGAHLLQLSGWCPATSERIRWDRKEIGVSTLEELLRFERHPRTLNKDFGRRHHAWQQTRLSLWTPEGIQMAVVRGEKQRS